MLPDLILTLAEWHNQQKTEGNQKILEDYLLKAASIYEAEPSSVSGEKMLGSYLAIAEYANERYKHIDDYINGPEMKERYETIQKQREEVRLLSADKAKSVQTAKFIKERFANLDEQDLGQRNHFVRSHRETLSPALLVFVQQPGHKTKNLLHDSILSQVIIA